MIKKSRVTEAKAAKRSHPLAEPATSPHFYEENPYLLAPPTRGLLNTGDGTGQVRPEGLINDQLQTMQRYALARNLGRLQGNRQFQKTLAPSTRDKKPLRPAIGKENAEMAEQASPSPIVISEQDSPVAEALNEADDATREWSEIASHRQNGRRERAIIEQGDPAVHMVQPGFSEGLIQRQAPAGGDGSSAIIPVLPDLETRRALALDILKKAYGGLIKQETKVMGTANESQLRALYDLAMIGMGRVF